MQLNLFDVVASSVEFGRELARCQDCANRGEITRERRTWEMGTWVTSLHREDGCRLGIETDVAGTGCTCLAFKERVS